MVAASLIVGRTKSRAPMRHPEPAVPHWGAIARCFRTECVIVSAHGDQVPNTRSCIHTSDPHQRSTASPQGSRMTRRSGSLQMRSQRALSSYSLASPIRTNGRGGQHVRAISSICLQASGCLFSENCSGIASGCRVQ